MEENMNIVGDNIVILKHMALEMGDKISDQIQTIEDLNDGVKLLLLNPEVIHWDNSAFVELEI